TIASRCQNFSFRSVGFEDLTARMAFICQQEGIEADAEALAVLAQAGEGSLRRRAPEAGPDRFPVLRRGPQPLPAALARSVPRFAVLLAAALSFGNRPGPAGASRLVAAHRRGAGAAERAGPPATRSASRSATTTACALRPIAVRDRPRQEGRGHA